MDPIAWQPAQDYLLSLRRQGKTSVIVHHANRLGPRPGHLKAEDVIDVSIGLTLPEDYEPAQGARFTLSFDKSRGIRPGAWLRPFTARLEPHGGIESEKQQGYNLIAIKERIRDRLALAASANESPKSQNEVLKGVVGNQNLKFQAFREMQVARQITKNDKGRWVILEPGVVEQTCEPEEDVPPPSDEDAGF